MHVSSILLMAFVAAFSLAKAGALPSDYVVALLWSNGRCRGPPAVSIPIEIPPATTTVCDAGPLTIEGLDTPLSVYKNGALLTNPTAFIGMTCNGPNDRSYSYGATGCTTVAKTKNNFEEYCLTTTTDFGYPFPVSARLICQSNANLQMCGPRDNENKRKCRSKTNRCASSGQLLKWTPKSCKKNGKAAGTSGCQCVGYCGYTCKGACNKDPECRWNSTEGACWNKPSLFFDAVPGGPVPQCPIGGLAGFESDLKLKPKGLKDGIFLFVQALSGLFNK